MKRLIRLLFMAFVLLGISTSGFGQAVTKLAEASANIITHISLTKNVDMNFGNISAGTADGTVELPAVVSPVCIGSNVIIPTGHTGNPTAAKFTVTGEAGYTYSITKPNDGYKISDGDGHVMTISDWTTSDGAGTLTSGTQVIYIGGTLSVSANQFAGTYTTTKTGGDGLFPITVNYN